MTTGNIMNSYGKRTVKKADQPRKYAMQWPTLSALTALAIGLASRSQEQAGYTGDANAPRDGIMTIMQSS
jgi:hypothetical protein